MKDTKFILADSDVIISESEYWRRNVEVIYQADIHRIHYYYKIVLIFYHAETRTMGIEFINSAEYLRFRKDNESIYPSADKDVIKTLTSKPNINCTELKTQLWSMWKVDIADELGTDIAYHENRATKTAKDLKKVFDNGAKQFLSSNDGYWTLKQIIKRRREVPKKFQ